ncbi:hypothetical protein JNUCC74_11225 [Cerasibacillus sp. JNUCC 74]|uniref:hypothetical protein n=1 Tax=Virgibacillus proomii TaxID=84407 RepID=UPI0015C3656E|nr:hypothetical protein [Virgibacillus proomii]
MKNKKFFLGFLSSVMSLALLFGCDGVDEDEPDPTEEPSEQQQENNNDENNR